MVSQLGQDRVRIACQREVIMLENAARARLCAGATPLGAYRHNYLPRV